jgi:hypothetical protein
MKGQAKVKKVMKEWKSGNLRSGSGDPVKKYDQAVAIAMNESGMSKRGKKR